METKMTTDTKFHVGQFMLPVKLIPNGKRLEVHFSYSKSLITEVKETFDSPKYHGFDEPPRKVWSVVDSSRTRFRIAFLQDANPYALYDKPLIDVAITRSLYKHQVAMVRHILTRHFVILAGEMGVGKSLAFVESLDHIEGLNSGEVYYVGPKSGVIAVRREFVKWSSKFKPVFMTYQGLVEAMKNWDGSMPVPKYLCFDESSRLKNPTSQRSQSAMHLANLMREAYGSECYIVEMSGTPAPKAPTDWWHQSEVVQPGYIREGNLARFKTRLCLMEQRTSIAGGTYPHLITWLDDENKCAICGTDKTQFIHVFGTPDYEHQFKKSTNEIAFLHQRIKDLALIQFKRDCLDLPEKQYRVINVKPSVETLRAARLIRKVHTRAVTCLTLLRELSDGFQYKEEPTGEKEQCPTCFGRKTYRGMLPKETVDPMAPQNVQVEDFIESDIPCVYCDANGQIDKMHRIAEEIITPKDEALIELLDDQEDVGRFVIWAGFTATLDRIVNICHKYGWDTLRIDGSGYTATTAEGEKIDYNDFLDAMDATNKRRQELLDRHPRIAIVGHPKTGGMALTFNIAPVALFYSNDFDGEARMQAEDRIHRIGMDKNRGALIIDLIHLPTDQLVLDNLKKKKALQSMTMGELEAAFSHTGEA